MIVHNARVYGRSLLCVALALAPSAAATEGGIAVDAAERGCPSRAEVVSALEARLPGVTADGATRQLSLEPGPAGLTLRLRAGEQIELERRLTPDERAASPEGCEALAEAAALVVVRYLREIGYRPPEVRAPEPLPVVVAPGSPTPPRSSVRSAGYLGIAGAARAAPAASRAELSLVFQLHRGWLAAEVAAGATSQTVAAVPATASGELRLRAFPARLALGVPVRLGWATLVPAAGMGLDVLWFRSSGLADARQGVRLEPAAEVATSCLMARGALFGRLTLAGGLTLGGRDFDAGQPEPVFRTPGAYLRAQFELGVVLWKNGPSPSL